MHYSDRPGRLARCRATGCGSLLQRLIANSHCDTPTFGRPARPASPAARRQQRGLHQPRRPIKPGAYRVVSAMRVAAVSSSSATAGQRTAIPILTADKDVGGVNVETSEAAGQDGLTR